MEPVGKHANEDFGCVSKGARLEDRGLWWYCWPFSVRMPRCGVVARDAAQWEAMKEIGSVSVTTVFDVRGAGVLLMPFGAGFHTIPIEGSVACTEMAKQLIKVFGGGEGK
jgi:hypothetical protein